MQRTVLVAAGVPADSRWLWALRTATQRHPELAAEALYVRHNRAARCSLALGGAAPDAALVAPCGRRSSVHELADGAAADGRLLVLVAGSYS